MPSNLTKKTTLTAIICALLAVGAYISIPLPLPITMQTLVLHIALLLLGGRAGTIAVALYIALGAIGLPVFAGFSGGVGALLGPTGGYIIGMLPASLVYLLLTLRFSKLRNIELLSSLAVLFVIYLFGTLWFAFLYTNGRQTILSILSSCVFPFLIFDLLKLFFAVKIADRLKKSKAVSNAP